MRDAGGGRRKLVVFTEHRDTLNYLAERLRALVTREDAVVEIHGGMPRELRRRNEHTFKTIPRPSYSLLRTPLVRGLTSNELTSW